MDYVLITTDRVRDIDQPYSWIEKTLQVLLKGGCRK